MYHFKYKNQSTIEYDTRYEEMSYFYEIPRHFHSWIRDIYGVPKIFWANQNNDDDICEYCVKYQNSKYIYVYNVGRGLFDERKAYLHNDESNHAQHPFFPSYLVQISNVYV